MAKAAATGGARSAIRLEPWYFFSRRDGPRYFFCLLLLFLLLITNRFLYEERRMVTKWFHLHCDLPGHLGEWTKRPKRRLSTPYDDTASSRRIDRFSSFVKFFLSFLVLYITNLLLLQSPLREEMCLNSEHISSPSSKFIFYLFCFTSYFLIFYIC
jgi:hypothetical protein